MSDLFILSTLNADTPIIDLSYLATQLIGEWEVIELFQRKENGVSSLDWDMRINGSIITGNLSSVDASLTLDGHLSGIAQFVIWFRSLIPEEITLSLSEQSYLHDLMKIGTETNPDEIIDHFWS